MVEKTYPVSTMSSPVTDMETDDGDNPMIVEDVQNEADKQDGDDIVGTALIIKAHDQDTDVDGEIVNLLGSILTSVSEVCDKLMNIIPGSGIPSIVVSDSSKVELTQRMIMSLAKNWQKNCETAENVALDYIVGEFHHPVITCMREITKPDFITILGNDRFKRDSNELEQILICVALMDYVGVSLKNPMYMENFSKRQSAVRPILKKIFVELHRIFMDWAEKDPKQYTEGKASTMKYLRRLTPFFEAIQYEKAYAKALSLLDRDGIRAQRKIKGPKPVADRSALSEIRPNEDTEGISSMKEEQMDHAPEVDLTDETFDFLDDSPAVHRTAPVFLKSKKPKKSVIKSFVRNVPSPINSNILKRPAADAAQDSQPKRVCMEPSKLDMVSSESLNTSKSKPSSLQEDAGKVKSSGSKVNAFAFLMNRSKEIAKQDKLKKQQKMDAAEALKVKTLTPSVN